MYEFDNEFSDILNCNSSNFDARFAVASYMIPETRAYLSEDAMNYLSTYLPKFLGLKKIDDFTMDLPPAKKLKLNEEILKRNDKILDELNTFRKMNIKYNSVEEYATYLLIQCPIIYQLYSKLVPCPTTSIKPSRSSSLYKLLDEYEKAETTSKTFNDRVFVYCNQSFL